MSLDRVTFEMDARCRLGGVTSFHRTIHVDGYRCKMQFDGACSASHRRRISFSVP